MQANHKRDAPRDRSRFLWPLLVLVTVILCCVAAEGLIRLVVPEEFFWPVSNVYQAARNPDVGYTLRPNFRGVAFGVDLQTNQLGYRGPDWERPKPRGRFRIALVGDSHAFAYGVRFEESLGEVLASQLNARHDANYEVLNFGVPGYNAHNELAVLREFVLEHEPDVVVFIPSGNDHQPAPSVDAEGWLINPQNASVARRVFDPTSHQTAIASASWWTKSRLVLYLRLVQLRREFVAETNRTDRPTIRGGQRRRGAWMGRSRATHPGPALADTVYEPLREMIHLARDHGSQVCVAAFSAAPAYRSLIRELQRQEDVPILELIGLLPGVDSPESMRAKFSLGWDGHLNANAHALWAQGLGQLLDESGFLDQE